MATETLDRPATRTARGWAGTGLLVVLLLVAANAVYGGVALVVDGMGMPDEGLERLPVDTWTWPGAALLVTVALPQLAAAWVVWRRHPVAPAAGMLAGAALVLWIAVQMALLQRFFVLQPVIAVLGVVEILLAWVWWRRERRAQSPV